MELNFKKPELGDRELVTGYFRMNKCRSCEYTFGNLYLWSRQYRVEFTLVHDMMVFYYTRLRCFTFPVGDRAHLREVMETLLTWCGEREITFCLVNVSREQFAALEELYPGKFTIEYNRGWADYVYETEKLVRLSGKKYHGKKNHINKFQKLYPDWSYEPITADNVEECFQMALSWRNSNGCEEDPGKNAEICVTLNSLRLMEELALKGGLIRAGGRVVAFSIGEPVCDDTLVVHVEKAYADVPGAYTIINQQFLLHEGDGYTYVNREEDTGDEGLRRAKESYHPAFMVEKGTARIKGE